MADLSYLGKVDKSTLQYADQLERTKYWFERCDLIFRTWLYTSPERYKMSFEVKSKSRVKELDYVTAGR